MLTEIDAEALGYVTAQAKQERRAFIGEIENLPRLREAFERGYDDGVRDLASGHRRIAHD